MIAAKCREINENQLKVDIYKTCDEYLVRLKKFCLAHCAKGQLLRLFDIFCNAISSKEGEATTFSGKKTYLGTRLNGNIPVLDDLGKVGY